MVGALLLIVLCGGLLLPMLMVLLAVVYDAIVLMWAAYRFWHDEWAPRIAHSLTHLHVPSLGQVAR